ncbi:glycoside hydrolase family 47 protein [Mycena crocata]|nr:glycoside hydrolase family 47 protein [Mycena crocata]
MPIAATMRRSCLLQVMPHTRRRTFAFGHDNLAPVTKGFSDGRNGWGASIVDAMPTMFVMGLNGLFEEAVSFSSHIDFSLSQTPDSVSILETTIRYLGGLLSAYELSGEKYPALLEKAKQVADKMAFGWVERNIVPFNSMDFSTNKPIIGQSSIAGAGTLSIEWFTLSKYTKNATYGDLAVKAVKHIANLPSPLPGMPAQDIDPATGASVGGYVTWGGGSDSYIEYLIKYARLTNTDDPIFVTSWKAAVDSSIKNLLRTSTIGNHLYLADMDGSRRIRHVGSHLACFHAGNWLLGGKLLKNETIVNLALELNEGCWNTYASTVTGIGPETFACISADGNFTGAGTPAPPQMSFYKTHGFYIISGNYNMRPEVLESNFHAWRVTGDTKYLERAASAIDAFNKTMRAPAGFAELNDVNNVDGSLIDNMESFWFAETLKYLYLTFDDPKHVSLDDYVFNTECHPSKAPPALDDYAGTVAVKNRVTDSN